jgi:hypothetical protein
MWAVMWEKEKEKDGTHTEDSLQYINHGRGIPRMRKYIEIFSKKQDKNGM